MVAAQIQTIDDQQGCCLKQKSRSTDQYKQRYAFPHFTTPIFNPNGQYLIMYSLRPTKKWRKSWTDGGPKKWRIFYVDRLSQILCVVTCAIFFSHFFCHWHWPGIHHLLGCILNFGWESLDLVSTMIHRWKALIKCFPSIYRTPSYHKN